MIFEQIQIKGSRTEKLSCRLFQQCFLRRFTGFIFWLRFHQGINQWRVGSDADSSTRFTQKQLMTNEAVTVSLRFHDTFLLVAYIHQLKCHKKNTNPKVLQKSSYFIQNSLNNFFFFIYKNWNLFWAQRVRLIILTIFLKLLSVSSSNSNIIIH